MNESPLSLSKAQALGRYARGEISLHAVGAEFRAIAPSNGVPRWFRLISVLLSTVLAFMLVPASASSRRN